MNHGRHAASHKEHIYMNHLHLCNIPSIVVTFFFCFCFLRWNTYTATAYWLQNIQNTYLSINMCNCGSMRFVYTLLVVYFQAQTSRRCIRWMSSFCTTVPIVHRNTLNKCNEIFENKNQIKQHVENVFVNVEWMVEKYSWSFRSFWLPNIENYAIEHSVPVAKLRLWPFTRR